MISSVIPARLQFQCGHAALVTLPRVKGETSAQRNERVAREKSAALARQCDFCGPTVQVVVAAAAPPAPLAAEAIVVPATPLLEAEATPVQVNGSLLTDEVEAPVEPVLTAEPAIAEPLPLVAAVIAPPVVRTRRARRPESPATVPVERAPRQRILTRLEPAATERRFVVEFQVERVLRAANIREAMRQASALGATNILAITREG
jgi:hypothetical protein